MVRKHLVPRFGRMMLEQITLREVTDWLRLSDLDIPVRVARALAPIPPVALFANAPQ